MQRRQLLTSVLASLGVTGVTGMSVSRASARVATISLIPHKVDPPPSIVGAWRLLTKGAPEVHHILTFSHGIVTSYQADAGDPNASVSPGAGPYEQIAPGKVRGAFVEDLYDRSTNTYQGYVRIEFEINVEGNAFIGMARTQVFDASGHLFLTVFPTISGVRITL